MRQRSEVLALRNGGIVLTLLTLLISVQIAAGEVIPTEKAARKPERIPSNGVMVDDIAKGSQAEALGIELGDIIVSYDENPMASGLALFDAVEAAKGKTADIDLVVLRRGHLLSLKVKPGKIGLGLREIISEEAVRQWARARTAALGALITALQFAGLGALLVGAWIGSRRTGSWPHFTQVGSLLAAIGVSVLPYVFPGIRMDVGVTLFLSTVGAACWMVFAIAYLVAAVKAKREASQSQIG